MFKALNTISLLRMAEQRMKVIQQKLLEGQTLDEKQAGMLKSEFELTSLEDTDNMLSLIEVWLKNVPVHYKLLKDKEEKEKEGKSS